MADSWNGAGKLAGALAERDHGKAAPHLTISMALSAIEAIGQYEMSAEDKIEIFHTLELHIMRMRHNAMLAAVRK